ncbi:hypothetical protein [Aeromicrobium sp. 179-A 4D2 NHS]|uniref:hypothetical protein n=1 Tax=Aeromicrobium sp. 179-A 4D2 NHS TaxID=3142375 RepID=UPI0039A3A136
MIDPALVATVGYSAAAIEIVMAFPQTIRTVQQRNDYAALAGVSVGSMLLMLVHSTLWMMYGAFNHDIPIFASHAVNVPMFAVILYFVVRARRASRVAP